EYFPVEVQLRTMAMDFWASMEHRVCYKKQPRNRERLEQDFCRYARILEEIEGEFETHNERRGSDGG
ncbi:MAG: (p)ppGpp synthetase, partial [Clostridiales bacterium]|nr:(p)ppGpp synthetase [Clostridiales bacterium]